MDLTRRPLTPTQLRDPLGLSPSREAPWKPTNRPPLDFVNKPGGGALAGGDPYAHCCASHPTNPAACRACCDATFESIVADLDAWLVLAQAELRDAIDKDMTARFGVASEAAKVGGLGGVAKPGGGKPTATPKTPTWTDLLKEGQATGVGVAATHFYIAAWAPHWALLDRQRANLQILAETLRDICRDKCADCRKCAPPTRASGGQRTTEGGGR